jgi:DnaJ homolog subfamily C member 7
MRLARCQFALGSLVLARASINSVLALDPKNALALPLIKQIQEVEGHLRNFEKARAVMDWEMARLALDKCVQNIEGEIPTQWQLWRAELKLVKKNWEGADAIAV